MPLSCQSYRPRPTRKKIFLWKKTDMGGLRSSIVSSSSQAFLSTYYEDIDIDSMCAAFKTTVTSAVAMHVRTKMTSTRRTHHWVNTNPRQLIRRKQRAHRLSKCTRRDWKRFKKLPAEAQRSIRKAWKIESSNSKRLWSFIESKRQEASGVSALLNQDRYL